MRIKVLLTAVLLTAFLASCADAVKTADNPSPGVETSSTPETPAPPPSPAPAQKPSPSPSLPPSPSPSPTPKPSMEKATPDKYAYFSRLLPRTVKNDDGTETPLLLSVDLENYMYSTKDGQAAKSPIVKDFDGDGQLDTMTIETSHDFGETEDDSYNMPIRLTMRIADCEYTIESTWNDGLILYVTDFSDNDPYLDIFVFFSGTDIDGYFKIYRYDGQTIDAYTGGSTQSSDFTYDGKGRIFYVKAQKRLDDAGDTIYERIVGVLDYDNNEFSVYTP